VLKADDITISYSTMHRRMEHLYLQNAAFRQSLALLSSEAYGGLLEELTLVSRANSSLGVGPDPKAFNDDPEFQAALRARIGSVEGEDQRAFADKLRAAIKASGLNESEFRRLVFGEFLRNKVREKLTDDLPAAVSQAKLEVIVTNTVEDAQTAIARLNAGEEWGAVARTLSTEIDVQEKGGVKEFAPQGSFPPAYDDFAFTAPVGQISEALQAPNAAEGSPYNVVRVIERSEQPLNDDQKPGAASRAYDKWLTDTQAQMIIINKWDDEAQVEAVREIQNDPPFVPAAPAPPDVPTLVVPEATVVAGTPAAGATEPAPGATVPVPSGPVGPSGSDGQ
jgi:hypothetical protein